MIKINLLPIRAARKREYVQQQLILFAVLLIGAGVALYAWYSSQQSAIDQRKKQIAHAKQQIAQYKKTIGEVKRYEGLEEELNRKLGIIEDLIKGKTGPVRVMDRLSQAIPRQVWLLSWTEKGGRVQMQGEALTHKHVANFLSALKEPVKDTMGSGVAPGPSPGEGGKAPPKKKGKRFFSNIKLGTTGSKGQYVAFTISLWVNYAI